MRETESERDIEIERQRVRETERNRETERERYFIVSACLTYRLTEKQNSITDMKRKRERKRPKKKR